MTPHRYPCAEVIYLTSRILRPVHAKMTLLDLVIPDAVEDELAAGRRDDSSRVYGSADGVMEQPQLIPLYVTVRDN
jgi:hypothetical protein